MYLPIETVFESIKKERNLQDEQFGNLNVRILSEDHWGDLIELKIRIFWRNLLLDLDPDEAKVTILELVATGVAFLQEYGVVEKAEYYKEEKAVE